jgi:hypothetical protein
MDKVKVVLAVLKKHHFWVMTGMVVLLSFIGWFLATSRLWAEYQERKATIEGKFKSLSKINSEERENQQWIDGLEAKTGQLKVKVRDAWDKVYVEQKTNVLKWPEVLGPRYVANLETLAPTAGISLPIRRAYLNYIRKEFPRLCTIVDARDEHEEGRGAGATTRTTDAAEGHDYKVRWNSTNQKEIDAKLDLSFVPDSQLVRDTQEDLWVYHALLKIIANLNELATGNYNAKVKEITALYIGADAAKVFQEDMAEGRLDKPEASAAGSAKPITPAAVAAPFTSAPVARYVDEKGMPLAEGAVAAPEFKRMPVVMRLIMDQREIQHLLVECANSPLPVEVRQLHVHTRKGGAGQKAGAQQNNSEKDMSSYEMTVEVEGLIYIFNPPDPTKLGGLAAEAGGPPPAEAAGAGAPEAKANPAAVEPAPADGGKAVAEPDAAVEKPDAAMGKPDGAAEPDAPEKMEE